MRDLKRIKHLWLKVRRVWAISGLVILMGFFGWCLLAYRASSEARRAMQGDEGVKVSRGDGYWSFGSTTGSNQQAVGLVFFPGSLIEPAAYAPLARAIAQKGYHVLLVELPRRGVFGGADGDAVIDRARAAMRRVAGVPRWVIAGHSRGGAVAARFVQHDASRVAGLVLVGTSHPRSFSLADLRVPVVKVLGTHDGLATIEKSERTRFLLPPSTKWVLIRGGNHSQFGCYGFQPGDHTATVGRERQQGQVIRILGDALKTASSEHL